jgi:hypothetical protein
MKLKSILLTIILIPSISNLLIGQTNVKVVESDSITQRELFVRTMGFIGEYWKSAASVIDYADNLTNDMIIVKYKIHHTVYENMGVVTVTHYFNGVVKFNHKDGKSRIEVTISPNSETISSSSNSYPSINVDKPWASIMKSGWLREKNYVEIQRVYNQEIPRLIKDYVNYMKMQNVSKADDNW